jgi:protein phosphatase
MRAPNKKLVTRALGIDPTVDPEISDYQTEEGDLYLFCTDGLTDMVPDQDIEMTLQALGSNLRLCAQHLIANANDNGGRDNITVVLVRINRNRSIA